jgi:hypothetical protein
LIRRHVRQTAEARVTVAAIHYEEPDEVTHAFDIGTVDDRAAPARPMDESGACEDAEMRRHRVMRAADRLGDGARDQADRLRAAD